MRSQTTVVFLAFAACSEAPTLYQPLSGEVFGADDGSLNATAIVEEWGPKMDVKLPIGGFDYFNDPEALDYDSRFVYQFDVLPTSGWIDPTPWTGSYWPKNRGGIAYRWQTGEQHNFPLLHPDEVQQATLTEISQLSPAEKYDLYVGASDWPLTVAVLAANQSGEADWAGYCHGWAPASMTYQEPSPITVVGASGVTIPFGSSDIKALLTYFEGDVSQNNHYSESQGPWARDALTIGGNCATEHPSDSNCYDTNPAALHVLMANRIGFQGQSFIADVDPSSEKWNQPIHTYRSQIMARRSPSPGAHEDALEEVVLSTGLEWTVEINPQWNTAAPPSHSRTLHYSLELDASRQIIGGQWLYRLTNGEFITYHQAFKALTGWDGDGDGWADLSKAEVAHWMQEAFNVIDFAWVLRPGEFSDTFRDAYSAYTFLSASPSTNAHLFDYFAKLSELYERSTSGADW